VAKNDSTGKVVNIKNRMRSTPIQEIKRELLYLSTQAVTEGHTDFYSSKVFSGLDKDIVGSEHQRVTSTARLKEVHTGQ
jgi:hypothetical protein